MNKVLVAGIGNILRRDEGIGVYLGQAIKAKNIPGVEVEEIGTESWQLFALVKNFSTVILLDALETAGPVGKVEVWQDFEIACPGVWNLHEKNFISEVALAKKLFGQPEEFYLLVCNRLIYDLD